MNILLWVLQVVAAFIYVDYPIGTRYQPEEHEYALSRAHLLELLDGLEKLNGHPRRVLFRDFTIDPKP